MVVRLAIFAVGFFLRPLGGLYFGRLADRRGRRYSMVVSMCVTAAGCLVIAISPTLRRDRHPFSYPIGDW